MHVNDMFAKAIQQYADTVPNEVLKVNLLALAEHMGDRLVEILQIRQEFAVLTMGSYMRYSSEGDELPLMEEIEKAGEPNEDYGIVHQDLERQNKQRSLLPSSTTSRLCVAGRLFTDWVEDIQPEVHPDLEAALNLPGT